MDAKDLRTESALSERNNDGSKYSQSGGIALHCDRNKSYQDIGSNSLAKVDVQSTRPCAVIGPDRVVPPTASTEAFLKKGPSEPWPCMDTPYLHSRRPPEYPHKLANFQNPTRNISPRQTFQENMQRIMVPPSYNSVKISEDTNYAQMPERNNALPKNIKVNVPPEAKFCDVPYTVYSSSNEQKNVRNPEMCLSSVNPTLTRTAPHGWPPGSVNIRPARTYGAPELYQYQDFSSCAGPRPVVPRPNRTVPEEQGYVYADPFYHQEANIRFKPYPTVKERFPPQRYDYIGSYTNSFHPPPTFPSHKYEIQKPVQPHPYPPYPPIKYLDRTPEPIMEGYQRNQGNYNISYRNQMIHPNFGPVLGNCPQNKIHSYPPDGHIKTAVPNKLPYDNSKAYIEYENGRPKIYPPSESYLVNEMGRMHPMKSQVIMPNYPSLNMHNMPPNPYYKKDNQQMKNYEYIQSHFRNMDPTMNIHNPMIRHPPVFSPNTLAISPTDSSTSNETSQTLGTSQEDCGYVSQSSTASVRSMDSAINRIPNDYFRKYYDSRFGPIVRTSPMMSKPEINSNNSKEKKNIDVRQFLQMWNEGDEETEENTPKEIVLQTGPKSDNNFGKVHEAINQPNQEQLYVLGLVNVPSEELGKYEHIQKVSKLPENIKGYNHLELLNKFEDAIESSNMANYKTSAPKDFQIPLKSIPTKQGTGSMPPRPLSPLDVEAKISQSVIHKEVGCNFEIKPCSPKMLNVEVATPVQNILTERAIEKVANPVMLKSPRISGIDENIDCNIINRKEHRHNINNEPARIPSCKMVNTQFSNNNGIDSIKNTYSLQDLESNSGLCLASLPRLDNDIELNFPEVNQQFINANKRDSSVLTTTLRDLPTLDILEQSDNQHKDKINDLTSLTRENDIIKSPCIIDSEKEFTKLSKYRKTKIHSSDSKENLNAIRTDSVIIKNPENIKNCEENSNLSPHSLNKQVNDSQQTPINLTSQSSPTENTDNITTNIELHDARKDSNTAIDFSLNKTNPYDINDSIDIKNDNESDILTLNTTDINNSLLDEHLTKLDTLPDCDQNIHNAYINHDDKLDETIVPSSSDAETDQTANNKHSEENVNAADNPPLEEIYAQTDNLSSAANHDVIGDNNEYMSSVSCAKDINEINNSSLLPVEFVADAAEILNTTDTDNDNYLIEIDKNQDVGRQYPDNNELKDENQHIKENISLDRKSVNEEDTNSFEENKDDSESCHKVIKEVIESEFDINPLKDDDLKRKAKSTTTEVSEDILSNRLKVTDKQILDNDSNHSICSQQKKNSIVDLHSLNDIVTNNQMDITETKEIENKENGFNLSSPKNDEVYKQDHEFSKRQNNSNFRIDNDLCETMKQEMNTNFNLLSPSNITYDRNDDISENIEEANSYFDLSSNNTDKQSQSDTIPETIALDSVSNLNLASANSSVTPKIQITYQNTDLNIDVPCNNIITQDVLGTNDSLRLLEEVSEFQNDISRNEDLQKAESKSVVQCSIKSPVKNEFVENNIRGGLRFFSYGGKEMLSPWIQNLIMFREGKANNVKTINDDNAKNVSMLVETERMEVSCRDHLQQDNIINQLIENPVHYDRLNVPTYLSESVDQCDTSSIKDCSKMYNDECRSDKDGKLYDTFNQNKNNNPVIECTPKTEEINKTLTESVVICATINKSENHDNTLDSIPNLEQSSDLTVLEIHEQSNSHSHCSDDIEKSWDGPSNCYDEMPNLTDEQSNCDKEVSKQREPNYCDEIPDQSDKHSDCNDKLSEQSNCNDELSTLPESVSSCYYKISDIWNKPSGCNDKIPKQWDKHSTSNKDVLKHLDKQLIYNGGIPEQSKIQNNHSDEQRNTQSNFNDDEGKSLDIQSNSQHEVCEKLDKQSNCGDIEVESTTISESNELSCANVPTTEFNLLNQNRLSLKRSLSDSALNIYNNNDQSQQDNGENVHFIWPFKRRKINNVDNDTLAQNLCNIIQNNRRNSISSIYNEDNVSFCILIDNSCIISEEENYEQEKLCYTELSEECLADVNDDCIKDEEKTAGLSEIISTPRQENDCGYSDSYVMQGEDDKLEESWVEDVACVETVISDDIVEDIEISGPSSPKDEALSDNDESGVFSSCEHTEKVKYIYGDNMCNDDAQFVETLYNTPQMNVNRTLVQRETLISGEYYDNDSLEKILSESNEQDISPFIPEYTDPVFSPRILDIKSTLDNKENMEMKSVSSLERNRDALEVTTDAGIDEPDHETVKLGQIFEKAQDDTIHSCESSVDNVFSYKDNDENKNYITSSSPEVSSTTSEEKNSAILLKITNYKGSIRSQIGDIGRDNKRPSCKFTEDKDYVQSHSKFSTHRPLLTKAAQKYIPPLKESMRDLKVKLSLPQHSLMKLKQLKNSKEHPKTCKQNVIVPRISKKPKPKFEDVLKSIDELQFKMHKEKTKKSKKSIPKVVIKKNENGSHYASTSNKDDFNPDLTGRKWQPWVFIEKNHFIDKMAIKKKNKAVYSHRKQTYVLAEKFQKYKSVNSAKFVISPPISDCPSTGLKYTIRLKHNY